MLSKKSRVTPVLGETASWERITTASNFIWLDDDRLSKLTNSLPETYCTAVNAIFLGSGTYGLTINVRLGTWGADRQFVHNARVNLEDLCK